MKPFRLSRRAILRGFGVAIALPALEAMSDNSGRLYGVARADAAASPVRLILMMFPHGCVPDLWIPKDDGPNYTLSDALTPLADLKGDFNVVTGLADQATMHVRGFGGHGAGMAAFATGVLVNGYQNNDPSKGDPHSSTGPGGPSVDQALVQELNPNTALPSLVIQNDANPYSFADGFATTNLVNNISWRDGKGNPELPYRDPGKLFNDLVTDTMGATSPATVNKPIVDLAAERGKSTLDFVAGEIAALQGRLGAGDKARLDQHLTAVREIEKQLATVKAPVVTGKSCVTPTNPGGSLSRAQRMDMNLKLITMAISCNITRYVSFACSNGFDTNTYDELTGQVSNQAKQIGNHHSITHANGNAEYGTGSPDEQVFVKYFVGLFGTLLRSLKSINALDDTLIYFGSENGKGNHDHSKLPVLLAGRAGGRMQTGRHIRAPDGTPASQLLYSLYKLAGGQKSFANENQMIPGL